ncbi:hypothetical protein [Dokdonella sp.]|uniref:hypothetical protein n=1 Tax=Dokdonella sp. TaxID=2291710 RepID=UPI003784FEE5
MRHIFGIRRCRWGIASDPPGFFRPRAASCLDCRSQALSAVHGRLVLRPRSTALVVAIENGADEGCRAVGEIVEADVVRSHCEVRAAIEFGSVAPNKVVQGKANLKQSGSVNGFVRSGHGEVSWLDVPLWDTRRTQERKDMKYAICGFAY